MGVKMKIYLYGSITGNIFFEREFQAAYDLLDERYHPNEIINPVDIYYRLANRKGVKTDIHLWLAGMAECVSVLKSCTHYYRVNDFNPCTSGARIEEYYFELYEIKELTK